MAVTLSFSSSLFCLLGILLLHGAAVTGGCYSMEREALLDFKAGVGDTRNRLSSWTGHHCCTWKGVACDTTTGHVVMLDLRNTNITEDWALRGERMNSSLLALSHLKHLDLSFNDFSGIRMPEFIGSFKKLRYLNLSEYSSKHRWKNYIWETVKLHGECLLGFGIFHLLPSHI